MAFPLREGTEEELGRWISHRHVPRLMRFEVVPLPELCPAHGAPSVWSKQLRIWADPETDYHRKSRLRRILHDLGPGPRRLNRGIERAKTAPSVAVTAHGCRECTRWVWRRRAQTALLAIVAICLLTAVPRALVLASQHGLAQLSLIAGIIVLLFAAKSWNWLVEFSRASVSDNGTRLIISRAHPDYVRASLVAGAHLAPAASRDSQS